MKPTENDERPRGGRNPKGSTTMVQACGLRLEPADLQRLDGAVLLRQLGKADFSRADYVREAVKQKLDREAANG